MANYTKSAKDIAFDKERAKFRHEIGALNHTIKERDATIRDLNDQIAKLESETARQQDWINRLLEYMDLPEEDFKKLLEAQKSHQELQELLQPFSRMFQLMYP